MEGFKSLTYRASEYQPTSPRSGNIGRTWLRLKNMILTGLAPLLYFQSYRGSLDLSETITLDSLTGTLSAALDVKSVVGSGTLFTSELQSGQRFFSGNEFFMVDEITDDTHLTVYRGPTVTALSASTAKFLPVIFDLNRKRGTLTRSGNAVEFAKGTIIGTGVGTLRRNGVELPSVVSVRETRGVGTGADDAAVGTMAWTNPGNITASGGGVASSIPVGAAITTHYLKGTNCGFAAIPAGATITGIAVTISKRVTGATLETVLDSRVRIVKPSGAVGTTDRSSALPWPNTNFAYSIYGGSTDLWGETWVPADFADVDVGAVISAVTNDPGGESATLEVDYMFLTVYYTTAAGTSMVLTGSPQIAVYIPTQNKYAIYPLGLPAPTVAPTVTGVAGGTHGMIAGDYSLREVPSRSATNGYGNPGPRANFNLLNDGDYAQVDATLSVMDTAHGQDERDIYATQPTTQPRSDSNQGPWDFVRTVPETEGNIFPIDYLGTEINRQGEVDFDNDPPPESGFIAVVSGAAVGVSCDGKYGGSPGPAVAPFKPQNIEASPAGWRVKSSPPQDLLGVVSSQARLYFPTAASLQTGVFADTGDPLIPPLSLRSYWNIGFSSFQQLIFVANQLIGAPHSGPTRSVADAENVDEQYFGDYVAELWRTFVSAHMLVEHDPDPNVDAVCFFHPAHSLNAFGYWTTRVLLWGLRQSAWIGDVLIESTTRDMIACSVAKVGQHLEFLAGGNTGGVHQKMLVAISAVDSTGTSSVIVTAAGMTGTPKTLSVPVTAGDSATAAADIRAALEADADVSAYFMISGTGVAVILVKKVAAANDATMTITISRCTIGLTGIAGSAGSGVQVDTFRWNQPAGVAVDYYAVPQLSDGGAETQNKTVKIMRPTGKFTSGFLQLHGFDSAVNIDMTDIEDGVNSVSGSIALGTQTDVQQLYLTPGTWPNLANFTPRISGTYSGSGEADELHELYLEFQPTGVRK